ncbi:helix-turn-helix domain-containing protein [Shewanella algae]|nr:helix-turn-helix domain-containing protein [Shewanella algae]MBO2582373.1 helix-turn-helix domain-containing protein [Shewanella algae]
MLKDVLREAREARKLKQAEVAEYVGVTPQTYMKWENGKNEPKASNIKLLAEILKISESEICRGEVKHFKMEPLEFVRRVGILMSEVPQTEMLIGMHEYINDTEGFIDMLSKVSNYPYELFEIEEKEARIYNAKFMLKVVGQEAVEGESELYKKAREHALSVLEKAK